MDKPTESVFGFVDTKKDKIEKRIAWGILNLKKGSPEVEIHLEKLLTKAYKSLQKDHLITAQKHLDSARRYAHTKGLFPSDKEKDDKYEWKDDKEKDDKYEWKEDKVKDDKYEWKEVVEQFGGFRLPWKKESPQEVTITRAATFQPNIRQLPVHTLKKGHGKIPIPPVSLPYSSIPTGSMPVDPLSRPLPQPRGRPLGYPEMPLPINRPLPIPGSQYDSLRQKVPGPPQAYQPTGLTGKGKLQGEIVFGGIYEDQNKRRYLMTGYPSRAVPVEFIDRLKIT